MEQTFCEHFQIMKNDEEVYVIEKPIVTSRQMGSNLLRTFIETCQFTIKAIDVFLTMTFWTSLHPHVHLVLTTCMTRNTLIKHKEDVVICEESGLVITNYNVLLTQQESKLVAQPMVN